MPRIDTSSIEGYADMSADEKLAALEAFEYDDGSEELGKYKSATTRANGEAAEYKRQLKAAQERLAEADAKATEGQSEAERKLAEVEKKLAAMEHAKTVSDYTARLASQGFDKELSGKAAKALADHDADGFFDALSTFVDAHDKALRADMAQHSIAPRTGTRNPDGKTGMTRKKLDAMTPYQRSLFSAQHPEEYAELTK